MMDIIKGSILSPPRMIGPELIFFLWTETELLAVIRRKRQAQKLDMAFLCPGQRLLLAGRKENGCFIAEKIRIEQRGVCGYGDHTAVGGADAGDPKL